MADKILVIRSGALGDSIVSLPAIGALRKRWPDSRIEVIGSPPLNQLVSGRYYADRAVPIDASGFAVFFTKCSMLPKHWAEYFKSFDLIVCFIKDECLVENLKATGARKIVHMGTQVEEPIHMVDRLLRVLEPLGIKEDGVPKLFLNEDERLFASRFWNEHDLDSSKVIAVHPGSGSRNKNWPLENFRAVAKRLISEAGIRMLVPSGEADEGITGSMVDGFLERDMITVKERSLTQLGALFEKCILFLGNDSGLSHLAAASGTVTLCVFGPTDSRIWAPRGKVTILRKEFPCSPCVREKMLSCKNQICLQGVDPNEVIGGIKAILTPTAPPP